MDLTHSLEDYLEAIWVIKNRKQLVRVKDIMKHLGFKVSSVNRALKILSQKGLVVHEKYEYVDLTPKGIEMARKIYGRHKTLANFLHRILDVDETVASKDACNLEHYLSEETYKKLNLFVSYLEKEGRECLNEWYGYLKTANEKKGGDDMTLSQLKPGERAIIRRIDAPEAMKQRFLSMGLLPGEKVSVQRKAPLGDPMDITIKGYHLSLRKDEASMIIVEAEKK